MKAQRLTKETISSLGLADRKFPAFKVGDTIVVSQKVKEGDKTRTQDFEGDVIASHSNGASSTFTVRKMGANGVPVEKIFPYHAPVIETISVKRRGDVNRAKLYFLRKRVGKSARVQELVQTKEQKEAAKAAAA